MKCLIAEDDMTTQRLLLAMLADEFECAAVENGREAVDAASRALKKKTPYDLICMDIEMPFLNGQEALKEIRQIELSYGLNKETRSKIIMTTASSSGSNILQAAKSGCDAYILKPFSKMDLFDEIDKLHIKSTEPTEKVSVIDKIANFLK